MKKNDLAVSWIIIVITMPILGVLAWYQYNWLQELSNRDKKRIEYSMMHSANTLSKRLQEEIFLLPSLFRLRPEEQANRDVLLAERYKFWQYYAIDPSIISQILLINDKNGAVLEWNTNQFIPSNHIPRYRNPEGRFGNKETEIIIRNPFFLGMENRFVAEYYFDTKSLVNHVIPKLANDCLESTDLYRYRIVDSRNGTILYASEKGTEDSFNEPDIELPLVGTVNNPDFRQPQTLPSMKEPGDPDRSLDFIKGRAPLAHQDELDRIPFQDFGYLSLQIVNRDGSLQALTGKASIQNAAISFITVMLLLLAMAILAEVTRRSRHQAVSQQEFIATITHELKTPLAIISSAAQNLGDGLVRDQKKAEQYGTVIRKEASRLSVSIEHFLLYANTHSLTRTKPELCDVGELVKTALKFTEEERLQYDFRTEVVLPEEAVFINGDRIALESVFQNLAQNVIRHARDGKYLGILVSLGEGIKKDPRRRVTVQFRDKGRGIPRRELKLIFEPFARGKRAIANQIPGNGVGLNLVKRIITMHEGNVRVESKNENGSTFIITVPESKGDYDA